MATELATAFVSLVPSFKGGQAAISKEMGAAGTAGGQAFGGTFAGSFRKLVAPVAGIFAAVGVGKFVSGVIDDFKSMEANIIAGTGASGQALRGLTADATTVGKQVPTSFADAGAAIADWNTALGLTGKPLQELSAQTIQLAKVTGVDLSTVIANNSRVLGDWGIATEDAAATQDKLLAASQATGIGVDQLAQNLVKFGAPLRQLGFDFDSSAALIGKFQKEGVNTELVLGSMRQALGNMAREGEPAQETFRRVTEEIANAGSASKANAIALELFGSRAGPDMAAAIREGRFEIDELVATISDSDGVIADTEKRTRTFGDQWQIIKNQVLAPLQPVVIGLTDALIAGMSWLTTSGIPALRSFADWLQRNRTTILIVSGVITAFMLPTLIRMGVVATASAARTVAAFALMQASAVRSAIVANVALVGMAAKWVILGTQALINAAKIAVAWLIALGPIGLIIAAVIAVAGLFVLLWQRSETFRNIVTGVFKAVWSAIQFVWNWIKQHWPLLLAILTGPIGLAVLFIVKNWDKIKAGFQIVVKAISKAVTWVKDRFINGWRNIQSGAQKVRDFLTGIPGKLRDGFRKVTDYISAPFKAAFNAISGLWNRTLGSVSFEVPSWVPGVGGKGFSFPQMPTLAQGGIVRATPGGVAAILAEGGQDEVVIPLNRLDSILGAGGGMPDEFVAVGTIDLGDGITQKVEMLMRRKDRSLKRRVTAGAGVMG